MAGAGASKGSSHTVSLKSVKPVIPAGQLEKEQLIADLEVMGCEGLILEPWNVKSEEMVNEFLKKRSNEWLNTIRRDSDRWTSELWADVYGFKKEGRARCTRMERWIDGKFRADIDAKDGHAVCDCIDPREKRVLEFVVPILHPEKPNRVTKEIGNTVFGALSGQVKIKWGQFIYDLVSKQVSVLGSRKISPLGPYLYHLYGRYGCLREEEQAKLKAARECMELELSDEEQEGEPDEEEESDRGSLSPEVKPPVVEASPLRMKTSFRAPKGKEPMRSPDLKDLSFLDLDDEPFARMQVELDQVQSRYTKLETVVKGAARLLGDCKAENIGKEIRRLKSEDSATLKVQIEKLKLRVDEQQKMMAAQEEQISKLKADWAGFEKIRLITEYSGDIALKAHLYDEARKMDTPLTNQKSVLILSKYAGRVEEALAEMRKIWPGHGSGTSKPSAPSPSQPSVSFLKPSDPSPTARPFVPPPPPPSPKVMSPTISSFEALKARVQERRVQAATAMAATIEVPLSSPLEVPSTTPEGTGKPESRATSSESNRKGKRVRKLPTEEDEVESLSSTGDEEEDEEEEEEEEPSTPSPERPSSRTRSASKRTPPPAKPSTDRKRKPQAKSPKRGSSTKKGRKK
jgi:hypothetical protein